MREEMNSTISSITQILTQLREQQEIEKTKARIAAEDRAKTEQALSEVDEFIAICREKLGR